jgi:hypothetical protein
MDKNRGVWLTVLGLIQGPNKAARKKKGKNGGNASSRVQTRALSLKYSPPKHRDTWESHQDLLTRSDGPDLIKGFLMIRSETLDHDQTLETR